MKRTLTKKQVKAANKTYYRLLPPRNDGKDGQWDDRKANVIGKGKVKKWS